MSIGITGLHTQVSQNLKNEDDKTIGFDLVENIQSLKFALEEADEKGWVDDLDTASTLLDLIVKRIDIKE